MLSTVLDRLTSLLSKQFVVGAFIPVLIFAFINSVILYSEAVWFQSWVTPRLAGDGTAYSLVVALVGVSVVAYVLWSLNGFLRQVLEGYRLGPDSTVGKLLRAQQHAVFERLRTEYVEARDAVFEVSRSKRAWTDQLVAAAEEGQRKHRGTNTYDGEQGPAAMAIKQLKAAREGAEAPPMTELRKAVAELSALLKTNDVAADNPRTMTRSLSIDRAFLVKQFNYAEDEWVKREMARRARFELRFASDAVAATALGNVTESMNGYALSRYRFDLTTFWTRLQPLLGKHEEFYGTLQDAKEQVDFLVVSVWLCGVTTLAWLIALPLWGDSVWRFVAVAVLGPMLTRILYLVTVENYVAFGQIVRAAVDLYRFDLLDALRMPRPVALRDERRTWDALRQVASFGEEWMDYSYRKDADKPAE